VLSRIIMTPQHMKLLIGAMKENLDRYEAQYGEIRVEGAQANHPFGFRTGPVQAGGNSGNGGDKVH
jgi:hypothetical protein